ncbi:MAG: hypothetical protein HUU37_05935 [Bdellovibrionales bacterium]|nr:hypothetical protein [Bdellovibrionales bacterium]
MVLRLAVLAFLVLVPLEKLQAGEFKVYGVKTEFPMEDGQTIFKDVYVSMGTNQGIKAGTQLVAYRMATTSDDLAQKSSAQITFPVAKLRVIHAEATAAVARVVEVFAPSVTPLSGYTNVMVGDTVELAKR